MHAVAPLEGLWSAEDLRVFRTRDKAAWDWTLLLVQPDWVTGDLVRAALDGAAGRRAGVERVRFAPYEEGRCVQVLHVGAYDDEGPLLEQLHASWLPAHGLVPTGRHHEIHLSDPRRTAPARLRTLLRQPVGPG